MLNNLGFSCLTQDELDDARTYLRRALEMDASLQAAHHNLVVVFLSEGVRGKPIPNEAFLHAARALEIGPKSADLYFNVAALYATAAKHDAKLRPAVIEYVGKAVAYGEAPDDILSELAFEELRDDPAFRKAVSGPCGIAGPKAAAYLVDPLDEPEPSRD